MANLQKFKFLASQCAVSPSPTRSPTTSPVFHLRRHHHRRRKTLRMLLSRTAERHRDNQPDPHQDPPEKRVRRKLKDLFVSSPPLDDKKSDRDGGGDEVGLLPATGSIGVENGLAARRGAALRPVSAMFRYRLLRRAWRPVLLTIPE